MNTREEDLIERYFDAFNRHDIDGVMACFHDDVAIVGSDGVRVQGLDVVRDHYERDFAVVPDGRCDLQTMAAHDGRGVAESLFHGTLREGKAIKAIGAEIIEFADGKIKEIRDYHRMIEA
jgi:ketosteroid isomerase-like protein